MAQKRALLEAVAYNLRVFLTFPLPLPWILKVFFPPARKTSPPRISRSRAENEGKCVRIFVG